MAAAEVMRGEKTMADITYDFEGETEIYGSTHPRPTALAKVTGLADYGDDVALQMPEGIAHLAVVLAEAHHANIISIDTSEAEKMPGVIKVMTAKDVKGTNNMARPAARAAAEGQRRHASSRSSPARRSAAAATWSPWSPPTPTSTPARPPRRSSRTWRCCRPT